VLALPVAVAQERSGEMEQQVRLALVVQELRPQLQVHQ
jgi:hypothetical protein